MVGAPSTITFFARWRSTDLHGASGEERNVGFSCLTWLYGLFVRTLISVINAYASCGRPTVNFIERFWLARSVRVVYCVRINYAKENLSLRRRSREPSRVLFKELLRVFKKNRKLRRLTREHISKNIPKS